LGVNNQWLPVFGPTEDPTVNEMILKDGTNDLTKSGIIQFKIPDDISSAHTLFDDQLHWLRAVMMPLKDEPFNPPTLTDAVCKMISIDAQAAEAIFDSSLSDAANHNFLLAENIIAKLVTPDAALKKITQPAVSFNGIAKETDPGFYRRVSERLRHKQRAVAPWDYERLVLQKFPQVYKVKCLNHTRLTPYDEICPGHVLLIPLLDLTNRNVFDPLKPYTPVGLLTDIDEYLRGYTSPFVDLKVGNPLLEEIQVDFCVQFMKGTDENYFKKFLDQQITQFLSPWAFDASREMEFGGKISKSAIIYFVEQQDYVDYVINFSMFKYTGGHASANRSKDLEEVTASTGMSVLVSFHESGQELNHSIKMVGSDGCKC
jgi:hypothetical protein